jgi:molybdopterin biosynthesis enzyme
LSYYIFKLIQADGCQGFDIEKDSMVLKSGERVGASEIGLLASMGVMMVKVFTYFCA